jgi:hypothetical protein
VTIVPVFKDATARYTLDFTTVTGGTMPPGWRCVQEDNTVHEYNKSYDNGARTFAGFTGYQGKALYWREEMAEYGRQSAYPLNLEPGSYKLTFATAAWKLTPKFKVEILDKSTNEVIASSSTYSATPNANGNNAANLSTARLRELPFTIEKKANYVIRFSNMSRTSGNFDEYLLLECRINTVEAPDCIELVEDFSNESQPIGIYNTSGVMMESMQPGVNIIKSADGQVKKVWKK